MAVLYLAFYLALNLLGRLTSKKLSIFICLGKNTYQFLFIIVNSIIACIIFYFTSGFSIVFSLTNILFGIVTAVVCTACALLNIIVLKYNTISNTTVVQSSSKLVIMTLLGFFLFHEEFTIGKLVLMLIILVAVFFVFADNKIKSNNVKTSVSFLQKIIPLLLIVLFGSLSSLINKYYTLSGENSSSSFFFILNVFSLVFGLFGFAFFYKKENSNIAHVKNFFNKKYLLVIALSTLISNLASIVNLKLIALIGLTVLTPIQNAFGYIAGVLASLIYREKLGKYSYMAFALSVLAVVIYAII